MRYVRSRRFRPRGNFFTPDGFREKLGEAFKAMRKRGLMARQNFTCCSSCGGYALATMFSEKVAKNPLYQEKIKGCVYYHKQSAKNLEDSRSEGFYLQFGDIDTESGAKTSLSSQEVGKIIVEVLTEHGIATEWDGNPDKCIRVMKKFINPVETTTETQSPAVLV